MKGKWYLINTVHYKQSVRKFQKDAECTETPDSVHRHVALWGPYTLIWCPSDCSAAQQFKKRIQSVDRVAKEMILKEHRGEWRGLKITSPYLRLYTHDTALYILKSPQKWLLNERTILSKYLNFDYVITILQRSPPVLSQNINTMRFLISNAHWCEYYDEVGEQSELVQQSGKFTLMPPLKPEKNKTLSICNTQSHHYFTAL